MDELLDKATTGKQEGPSRNRRQIETSARGRAEVSNEITEAGKIKIFGGG